MPPQARLGDRSMGHWIGPFYFPPTPLIDASEDDTTDCIASCRVGDSAKPHFGWLFGVIPIPAVIHTPTASSGSPTECINCLPSFRVGDSYSCGDKQGEGSPDHLVC